ncbi:hypothetical protein [Sphingobacterium kitahiroshimense]|uniref:hypothetical protein n=1 Tax=Sphingobacterium kitahiroshimense TaxID=470446 RepID=UPI00320A9E48
MENELYKCFDGITPAELAKLRGKRQETSTRDKANFLKKITEIEDILKKLNINITLEK